MLKIAKITNEKDYTELFITVFEGSKMYVEGIEKHECEELARYYCDTRGILIVSNDDYHAVCNDVWLSLATSSEPQARMWLTDKGYNLPT